MLFIKSVCFSILILGIACCAICSNSAAADMNASWEDKTTARISYGDRTIVHLNYNAAVAKPCIDQIFSPGGVEIIGNRPKDTEENQGITLTFTVDDVDFSRVQATSGHQTSMGVNRAGAEKFNGINAGFCSREIGWFEPKFDYPLLVENRLIEAYYSKGHDVTLICWQSCLKPSQQKHSVAIKGNRDSGLQMRLPKTANETRLFNSSDRKVSDSKENTPKVDRIKWCAYSTTVNRKPITVALFDHPDNFQHSMVKSAISEESVSITAMVDQWEKPIIVEATRPLTLRYGIAVWDGDVTSATVENVYERWINILRAYPRTNKRLYAYGIM